MIIINNIIVCKQMILIHQCFIQYNCMTPFFTGSFSCWGIMGVCIVITPHSNIDARCVQASAPLYYSGCPELDSGLLSRPVKNKLFVIQVLFSVNKQNSELKQQYQQETFTFNYILYQLSLSFRLTGKGKRQ